MKKAMMRWLGFPNPWALREDLSRCEWKQGAVFVAVFVLLATLARGGMMTAPSFGFPPPGRLIVSPIYSVAVQVANGFLPRMACVVVTTNGVVIGTPNYAATTSVPVMVMDDWEVGWNCQPATKYVLTVTFNHPLPASTKISTSVVFE